MSGMLSDHCKILKKSILRLTEETKLTFKTFYVSNYLHLILHWLYTVRLPCLQISLKL